VIIDTSKNFSHIFFNLKTFRIYIEACKRVIEVKMHLIDLVALRSYNLMDLIVL
jgi:hypothetical protein